MDALVVFHFSNYYYVVPFNAIFQNPMLILIIIKHEYIIKKSLTGT